MQLNFLVLQWGVSEPRRRCLDVWSHLWLSRWVEVLLASRG